MTNPDNIVRVRARNGGRASVYEANGWCQAFSSGLVEGYGVTQNTVADMNVLVGGSATKPDVVLAVNPSNYKIALDLVGQQAIAITAPASNSRISAIVAYTDDLSLATTEDTVTGSPASCGLIVVNGTAAANPVAPNDTQIRAAITSDGATGSQAAYCIIATIEVASGATTITNDEITVNNAVIPTKNLVLPSHAGDYSTSEQDTGYTWIDGKAIYKKTVSFGTLPNATSVDVPHGITGLNRVIVIDGYGYDPTLQRTYPVPYASHVNATNSISIYVDSTNIHIGSGIDRTSVTETYITLYYTKS